MNSTHISTRNAPDAILDVTAPRLCVCSDWRMDFRAHFINAVEQTRFEFCSK